jgi:hypothetical protein
MTAAPTVRTHRRTHSALTTDRKDAAMAHAPTTWSAPSADGRLEVFVVGTDHHGHESLWHRWQTADGDSWSEWFSHGTPSGSNGLRWSPAVAPGADGRLEVFVVGDDVEPEGLGSGGALYHLSQTAPKQRVVGLALVPHRRA